MSRGLGTRIRTALAGTVLAALAIIIAPERAIAMGGAPCEDPFLFSSAAVNAVVLPFRNSGPDHGGQLSEAGASLATLMQLEVLMSLIKYQSVGAVVLRENEREGCDAVKVLKSLNGQIVPGHGLILIWGRLYEQEDQVYVQTYARFLRGKHSEEFEFGLTGNNDNLYTFKAPLPTTSLAFAPRRLSYDDIEQIKVEFREATLVRPSPDPDADGEVLHQDPDLPFAYTVTRVHDGWMYVNERNGIQEGWIRARNESAWPLRRKMPELALIDAIAGYLRLRAGEAQGVPSAPSATAANVRRAIEMYREYSGEEESAIAEATASVLQGLVILESAPSLESAIEEASKEFSRAAEQAPSDTLVRNLAAMSPIIRYARINDNPKHAQEAVQMLLTALSLDPDNTQALINLETLYDYLRQRPSDSPAFAPSELERRWEQVKTIRLNID